MSFWFSSFADYVSRMKENQKDIYVLFVLCANWARELPKST